MQNSWVRTCLLALVILTLAACDNGESSFRPPGGGGRPPSQLQSVDPAANETAAPADVDVTAVFNEPMNAAGSGSFVVNGAFNGRLDGMFAGAGTTTLSFDPDSNFTHGEEIDVTLTTGLTTTGGVSIDRPFVYRFLTAVRDTGSDGAFFVDDVVPVGDGASDIVAGDLDGDGLLDLAVANQLAFSVTVLLNNGNAAFSEAPGSPVPVGSQPVAILAGDWDGDGSLDLAVVNFFTDDITIFLNDGRGGFRQTAGSPLDAGSRPTSLTSGDLDGDGDLDVAVTNRFTFDVTVFLNNGRGDFREASRSPFPVGNQPESIESGDWDGDGDLDLAVVNFFTDDVTVLLNNGAAAFSEAPGSPVRVGGGPVWIAAGDWERDGDLDLAVANSFTDDVTVLLNDGNAGFRQASGSPIGVGSRPTSIRAGDWDADGGLDLVVANEFTFDVTVLLNDGRGRFNDGPASPVGLGVRPAPIAAGDYDEDGDVDLAVVILFVDEVTILRNG